MQLARILALKNDMVDVIYVSPFIISEDILRYYMKVLEVRNANSMSRLTIITPEIKANIPSHLSLTKALLISSQAIAKIKSCIKGSIAYIVPGIMSIDEVKLSCILGVPILGGDPKTSQLYSSKSGSRRIFNSADIPIPTGQYDIYDENEFEMTLTKLVISQPQISTWIFKIDDEFEGRGNASLTVSSIKIIKRIKLKEIELNEELVKIVYTKLHKLLSKKVVIAMPTLYKSWKEYIAAYCKHGGIIEAMPAASHEVNSPSVSFLIEPDGNIIIQGTYDRFNGRELINAGCLFPQTSLIDINHQALCSAVGKPLYDKGIFGYVTVDLISFNYRPQESNNPLFWGIGISCFLSNYTTYMHFFDFLLNGTLNLITGHYELMKEVPQERRFMCINHLNYEGLSLLPYKAFFHMCRVEVCDQCRVSHMNLMI